MEVGHQFLQILRERIAAASQVAAQRPGRPLVAAGSAAESQINPAREQRFQGPELLSDHQRRMIGQHHSTGTDADPRRAAGDVCNHHRSGGAGDSRNVVMLG